MNYELHYIKLINRAKERKIEGYTETHHIVPRCMNGSDNKDNLVNLTAREHFIAHILLVKIYPKEYGLINAVNMMTVSNKVQKRINNRMYGWLKDKFSERMSELQGGKGNSQYGTMWVHNLAEKISKKIEKEEFQKYEDLGWIKGRKMKFINKQCSICNNYFDTRFKYCSDTCKKQAKQNFVKSDDFVSTKGYKHTEETKSKIRKKIIEVRSTKKWVSNKKNAPICQSVEQSGLDPVKSQFESE